VIAPAWRGLSDDPAEVRRDPSPLHGLSIPDVIDNYEQIIRQLDRPPIIIGHSFGGCSPSCLPTAVLALPRPRSTPPRRRACSSCRSRLFAPPGLR
jgi:pimeloyl-ACP methyl ester carboxylesterase